MFMETHHLYTFRYRLFCEYALGKMIMDLKSDRLGSRPNAAVFVERKCRILKTELLSCAAKISAQAREEGLSYVELRRDFAVIILETLHLFLSINNSDETASSVMDVSNRHPA